MDNSSTKRTTARNIGQKLISDNASERLAAVDILLHHIQENGKLDIVLDAETISSLLSLYRSIDELHQKNVLSILHKLSEDEIQLEQLLQAKTIQFLVDVISLEGEQQPKSVSVTESKSQIVLSCIKNFLENDDDLCVELVKTGILPVLWNIVLHHSSPRERKASIQVLELISQNAMVRDEVLKEMERLIPIASRDHIASVIVTSPVDNEEKEASLNLLRNLDILKDLYKAGGKAFYDPKDFPWTKMLEDNWFVIREEFNALQQRNLIAWPEKNICKKGWDILGLYAFNNKFEENCALCPKTSEILEKIPGLTTALFSCLQPRTHIKPHIGYYQYSEKILRCHLGLIVPSDCAIKVNGETMTWQEGKCIVFDDTFRHESWNKSNTLRVVLMLDFVYNGDSSVRNQDFLVAAKLMEGRYSQNTKGSEQNDALITKDLMEALKMFGKVSNVKEQTF